MWLIGAAIVMALLAALAGFADFFSEPRIRALSDAWYHMIGNLTAVVIALVNFALRYSQGAEPAIRPWGAVLSLGGGWHPAIHRLEGLGDGVPPSGGCPRCARANGGWHDGYAAAGPGTSQRRVMFLPKLGETEMRAGCPAKMNRRQCRA